MITAVSVGCICHGLFCRFPDVGSVPTAVFDPYSRLCNVACSPEIDSLDNLGGGEDERGQT